MPENANDFIPAINRMTADIEKRDTETAEMKRMVNKLCGYAGVAPRYPDTMPTGGGPGGIKGDQFHGKPLATAVRSYLEMRGAADAGGQGAASIREIFDALKSGGFAFETKNDANSMRGLRISLAKNTPVFYRLPNGQYGLRSWYPTAKTPRAASVEAETESDEQDDEVSKDTEATDTEKVSVA